MKEWRQKMTDRGHLAQTLNDAESDGWKVYRIFNPDYKTGTILVLWYRGAYSEAEEDES